MRSHLMRSALTAIAMASAIALAFASGLIVARHISPLSPRVVAVIGLSAAVLVLLQLVTQLLVLARSARADRSASSSVRDLNGRNDQLWLLGRLCELIESECRVRRIAGRALDFFVEDIGAVDAAYWKPDIDGAPHSPTLGRNVAGEQGQTHRLPEQERVILARSAARKGIPVVVEGVAAEPEPLSVAAPPPGAFTLFIPLRAGGMGQGVIELESQGSAWAAHRWEILGVLVSHIGLALERGRQYEEMQQQADEDFTTGLYNHRFLQIYLQRLLAMARARGRQVAVLFLDIDDFKTINDTLGHGAGDRVLQAVADQLSLMTDRVGVVGRSGGDEFMVILPDHSRSDAEAFVQAFQDWLAIGTPAVNGLFRIRVSCGVGVFPDDADSRQELLAAADARLYRAKEHRGRAADPAAHSGNGKGERTLGVYGLLDSIVGTINRKDNYTRAHCERTAEYAVLLGQRLGLSPSVQRTLRLAGLLHDVGKIGIPDSILRKAGPLSDDEFEIIKHQVSIAGHLIVDIPNADEVRRLVQRNHEHWDGSGYPDGLKGEEIPYLARVLAVADAFSAMTLDRPFRSSLTDEDAYAELLRAAGTQLDPDLVLAFGEVMRPEKVAVCLGARDDMPIAQ